MRTRTVGPRLAAPLMAAGLVLAACSGSDNGGVQPGSGEIGSTNDINPQDPSALREGGNFRASIGSLPANWNALSVDGNEVDIASVLRPMMPRAYTADAANRLTVNSDYFTDIQLSNTNPQVVTYTINPKAVWSDGSPITWDDIRSQAAAMSGADKRFLIAAANGFDRVDKVERGVDDRQAVMTFTKHYAEWKGQFAGNSMLYPKSVTADPDSFNKSLVDGITRTAGPFVVSSIDRGQGRIVLSRNPKWWGAKPRLDTITFSVLDAAALVPALQNNELDVAGLAGIDDVKTARRTPGVVVRRAPGQLFGQLFFNGAPGSILADPKLRVAISKGIDRQGIATATDYGMVAQPKPLNNHIYLAGQEGYRDNSLGYDPKAAAAELDALGWKLNGDIREKDGRKLEIRNVMYKQDAWVKIAQIIQQNLARIGVKLTIDTRGGQGFFTDVIQPGNFDVTQYSLSGDAFPLSSLPQQFGYNPGDLQGNFGRIGSPELNQLIEQTVSELDPAKAIELANQVDRKVFEEGHSLPLDQTPGNVGARANLANYGARGLADVDYTKIGFTK